MVRTHVRLFFFLLLSPLPSHLCRPLSPPSVFWGVNRWAHRKQSTMVVNRRAPCQTKKKRLPREEKNGTHTCTPVFRLFKTDRRGSLGPTLSPFSPRVAVDEGEEGNGEGGLMQPASAQRRRQGFGPIRPGGDRLTPTSLQAATLRTCAAAPPPKCNHRPRRRTDRGRCAMTADPRAGSGRATRRFP